MKCAIKHEEKSIKKIINPNAKFILLGNRIDGYLSFNFQEFKDFNEVKEKLFDILYGIECGGEWDISLYQVREDYKIKYKYGYYKVPDKGKKIYSHSYMDHAVSQITFTENSMIIYGTYMDYWENWIIEGEEFENYELDISILKIKIK